MDLAVIAIDLNPANPDAVAEAARVYKDLGQTDKSIVFFNDLLKRDSFNANNQL